MTAFSFPNLAPHVSSSTYDGRDYFFHQYALKKSRTNSHYVSILFRRLTSFSRINFQNTNLFEIMKTLLDKSETKILTGNKMFSKVNDSEASRHPSPQPTHISTPLNGNGHRVLRSATVGYIAPAFTGKTEQMKKGERFPYLRRASSS